MGLFESSDGVPARSPVDVTTAAVDSAFGSDGSYVRQNKGITLSMLKGGRVEGRADPVETGLLKGRNALFAIRNEETAEALCDWLEWHKTLHGADAALVHCGATHNDLDVLERLLEPFASAMTFVLVQVDVAHSGENQRIV